MSATEMVFKALSEDEHLVFAEVYAPDVPDSDNEFMDSKTIQEMAYKFMKNLNLKNIDVQHNNKLVQDACVVESFIARKGDPDFIEGAWVVGVHIPNEDVWQQIKKGEINGFSLEALVSKTPMEIEVEIPPVLSGKTAKTDDHEHEFFVAYGPNGEFVGGKTSEVNGHHHVIKRGTATEVEMGHSHRFSFVEKLYG